MLYCLNPLARCVSIACHLQWEQFILLSSEGVEGLKPAADVCGCWHGVSGSVLFHFFKTLDVPAVEGKLFELCRVQEVTELSLLIQSWSLSSCAVVSWKTRFSCLVQHAEWMVMVLD